jgi:hypothetical protein
MTSIAKCAVVAGALLVGAFARAGELRCTAYPTVVVDLPSTPIAEVSAYPWDGGFYFVVQGTDVASVALFVRARAPDVPAAGLDGHWPEPGVSRNSLLPIGLTYPSFTFQGAPFPIESFEACAALPGALLADDGSVVVDRRLIIEWDSGQAQCTGRIVCRPTTTTP